MIQQSQNESSNEISVESILINTNSSISSSSGDQSSNNQDSSNKKTIVYQIVDEKEIEALCHQVLNHEVFFSFFFNLFIQNQSILLFLSLFAKKSQSALEGYLFDNKTNNLKFFMGFAMKLRFL